MNRRCQVDCIDLQTLAAFCEYRLDFFLFFIPYSYFFLSKEFCGFKETLLIDIEVIKCIVKSILLR